MRTLLLIAMAATLAAGQIDLPKIGYVRRPGGALYELRGVAGAFRLGGKVLDQVTSFTFDGVCGSAETADGPQELECAPRGETALAWLDGDELVVHATGVRLRLPFPVATIERAGTEYLLLSGDERQVLARVTPGRETLYEVPEVPE